MPGVTISPALPPGLTAALERRMHGMSLDTIAQRAAAISLAYRGGGRSTDIRTEVDAIAYAVTRMPATYAAIAASLNAIVDIVADFAPASLLDCGAGPGTATWAARQSFTSLTDLTAVDANEPLRSLAQKLAEDTSVTTLRYESSELALWLDHARPADLVIASYVINEVTDASASLADRLWRSTGQILLIVEPGTPAGYRNVLALRARLIAQGAYVVAPCPHDNSCPLAAPDWCHFSQRLPRLRAHRLAKRAEAPFEDERFSYVALSRTAVQSDIFRVLAPPVMTKAAVVAKLCTPAGIVQTRVPRRDRTAYTAARRWSWGDAITGGRPVNDDEKD